MLGCRSLHHATPDATARPANDEHVSPTSTNDDEWWTIFVAQIPDDRCHPHPRRRIPERTS